MSCLVKGPAICPVSAIILIDNILTLPTKTLTAQCNVGSSGNKLYLTPEGLIIPLNTNSAALFSTRATFKDYSDTGRSDELWATFKHGRLSFSSINTLGVSTVVRHLLVGEGFKDATGIWMEDIEIIQMLLNEAKDVNEALNIMDVGTTIQLVPAYSIDLIKVHEHLIAHEKEHGPVTDVTVFDPSI
jgi:hypothetical protein